MKTDENGKKLRTAGDVCRTLGIKPSSLRVYEEKKPRLVKPSRVKPQYSNRTDSRGLPVTLQNKWYGAAEMLRVMRIVLCRQFGFSLKEISALFEKPAESKDDIYESRLRELEAERDTIDRQINMIHMLRDLGDAGRLVSAMENSDFADLHADMIENMNSVQEKAGKTKDAPVIVYDKDKKELVRIAKRMRKLMKNGYCRTEETGRLAGEAAAYFTKTYDLDAIIPKPDSPPGRTVMLMLMIAFLTGGGEVTRKIEAAAGKGAGWMIATAIAHESACGLVERVLKIKAEYDPIADETERSAYLDTVRNRILKWLRDGFFYDGRMAEECFARVFGDEKQYRAGWEDLLSACAEPELLSDSGFPEIFRLIADDVFGRAGA